MVTAFAALEPRARQELADELLARLSELNLATDGTLVAPSPYLEAVIMRA